MAHKRENGVYYIDTEVSGLRVRKSLKTRNKVEAEKRERATLDRLIEQALRREAGLEQEAKSVIAPHLRNFYENDFLQWAEAEYKHRHRTLRSIKERMALVLSFGQLANSRLANINRLTLDRFKAKLISENYAGCTINNTFSALRLVIRTARRWSPEMGFKVFVPEFPRAKERRHDRVVTEEEERIYRDACPTGQHRVFFDLLINTGMEPGYAAAQRWEDVHFDQTDDYPNGWIHDRCQKTEMRPRDIPMTVQLRKELLEWWMEQARPEEGWLFPSDKKEGEHRPLWSFHTTHKRMFGEHAFRKNRGKGKRVFKHRWKEYGLKFPNGKRVSRFRLYDLRHTFLTRLGERGVGEIDIMALAGWSSTRMAARYVHPSKARLGRAVQTLNRISATETQAVRD